MECTEDPKARALIARDAADRLRAAKNDKEADKWVAKAARSFRVAGQYPECMALVDRHHAAVLKHITPAEVCPSWNMLCGDLLIRPYT